MKTSRLTSKTLSRHARELMLCLALLPPGLYAAEAAGNAQAEKILIQADHMLLNIETGNSVYTGNVRISQGELVLTGDRVTVEQDENEIERITVTGKPAHYQHVTETGENIQASSERMVYTASQHQLVMTINARLSQPDHQVSSEKIIYDTEKKLIMAGTTSTDSPAPGKPAEPQPRVKIILTPKKQPAP